MGRGSTIFRVRRTENPLSTISEARSTKNPLIFHLLFSRPTNRKRYHFLLLPTSLDQWLPALSLLSWDLDVPPDLPPSIPIRRSWSALDSLEVKKGRIVFWANRRVCVSFWLFLIRPAAPPCPAPPRPARHMFGFWIRQSNKQLWYLIYNKYCIIGYKHIFYRITF